MRYPRLVHALTLTAALVTAPAHLDSEPRPVPITHLATDDITNAPQANGPATCHRDALHLRAGIYTYGLRYYDGATYNIEAMTVPEGGYTVTDCLTPIDGAYLQTSYLDPAPTDPTSATIVFFRDPPPTTGPTQWGSFLIRN